MIDPYFFRWSEIGFPDDLQPIMIPDCIRVYMLSSSMDKRDVFLYRDRAEFSLHSKRDNCDVLRLFTQLASRCEMCEQPTELFEFYDSSELHRACVVKLDDKDVPVYRIRKASLRLYLVFVNAYIVLFRLSPKRKDKIDKSEKTIIDNRVRAIFKYQADMETFLVRLL
ncbi:hypothetical protein B2J61_07685 [Acinetobacter baumannii]|nr:hypothetical protein IX87_00230 [Acinetobacter baumannii]AYY89952.1 hypothetical protein EGM95_14700 [Acinetobacter baumannii]KAA8947676.1 hypothetical protein DLI66_04070 [Acinetobacter baumannii]KAF0597320.1 hypothetical protein AB71190_02873 [Acinetobacter baumannii]KAF0628070.1 hypothetical protein AB71191_03229 [Acinetobacter baumannii]